MSTRSAHPGNIFARERDNIASLKAVYSHQFPEPSWAYSWPDGWHRLVTEACAALDRLAPDGRWLQIKEKLGREVCVCARGVSSYRVYACSWRRGRLTQPGCFVRTARRRCGNASLS